MRIREILGYSWYEFKDSLGSKTNTKVLHLVHSVQHSIHDEVIILYRICGAVESHHVTFCIADNELIHGTPVGR